MRKVEFDVSTVAFRFTINHMGVACYRHGRAFLVGIITHFVMVMVMTKEKRYIHIFGDAVNRVTPF